ncbi:GGDEF domain-containing protein [Thiomicrorhabdus sediminis]|uniref:diguanylate cyclase n=1 Tax=Thiomicrorhabdus sediminis TaxID=2580412 RepID=A0A4P9K5S8_9GAMM|nr:GGDEF domain-containing protein [Thiomicrorhabdus sediminis]QCU90342.1 GGDEF domain-containing protein [Thiomicrorhabdus sediminis]
MIEIGYSTYKVALFSLMILFIFSILLITKQLRTSTFPVEIPSLNTFRIYHLVGLLAWTGTFFNEMDIYRVGIDWTGTGYILTTLLLLLVAIDDVQSKWIQRLIIAAHIAFTAFIFTNDDLFLAVETLSWFGLIVYTVIMFYFIKKAVKFRNKGYLMCAFGPFLIAMMTPFQLHALYIQHDVYLSYQLGVILLPVAFILVGLGFVTTILINEHQLLQSMAFKDPLTDMLNRRGLNHSLVYISEINKRKNTPISIILIDIDEFKKINDNHGHSGGDAALQQVAAMLLETARNSDLFCRLGGDEFILIMPETDSESAKMVAERMQDKVAQTAIEVFNKEFNVTLSMGITTKYGEIELDQLIHQADIALYQSKRTGRNRISVSEHANN